LLLLLLLLLPMLMHLTGGNRLDSLLNNFCVVYFIIIIFELLSLSLCLLLLRSLAVYLLSRIEKFQTYIFDSLLLNRINCLLMLEIQPRYN